MLLLMARGIQSLQNARVVMFTDGSRLEDGAAGYAVVGVDCQSRVGVTTHMGYNQEAYDAECVALARALEWASRRRTTPERVTVFTDALAAITRMASEEPGPGQKYALQARKHIACYRKPGRVSPSGPGGARHTRESLATKRPTSGPRSGQRSQSPAGCNG